MRVDAFVRRRRVRHVAMQRGCTLAEMGIVPALLAMIAGCAYPSLQRQLERRVVQRSAPPGTVRRRIISAARSRGTALCTGILHFPTRFCRRPHLRGRWPVLCAPERAGEGSVMRVDAFVRGRRRVRHVAVQRGCTLAEMGIVPALLAMIAGCAYPSLQRQLERRAVQNTAGSACPTGVHPLSARRSAGGGGL